MEKIDMKLKLRKNLNINKITIRHKFYNLFN